MTSSLVGSEMCIRDSSLLSGFQIGYDIGQITWELTHPVDTHKLGPWPVSYTHLTLPTICSV
eukprot:1806753-Prorocentrum_lima.AAC.1